MRQGLPAQRGDRQQARRDPRQGAHPAHPARAFEREWLDHGVHLRASTLLGRISDFRRWFAPLEKAIGARQQQALLAHGDETTWPLHVRAEEGRKARWWPWVCVTPDAVRMIVDTTRSTHWRWDTIGCAPSTMYRLKFRI